MKRCNIRDVFTGDVCGRVLRADGTCFGDCHNPIPRRRCSECKRIRPLVLMEGSLCIVCVDPVYAARVSACMVYDVRGCPVGFPIDELLAFAGGG